MSMGTEKRIYDPASYILVIEDDLGVLTAVCDALEWEGYAVMGVINGQEGLKQAQMAKPCLIILDIMMPIMDGKEFLKNALADPQLKQIPIVVFSADVHAQKNLEGFQMAGCLKKPIDLEVLLDVVNQHCQAS